MPPARFGAVASASRKMTGLLVASLMVLTCGGLAGAAEDQDRPPAQSGQPDSEKPDPGALAREGAENLLRAFEAFIDMIPQFEPPEMNEQGDIIIRRKKPEAPEPDVTPRGRPGSPEVEGTRT